MNFEVEEGQRMLKLFPFLVDVKTMTPDDCNDVRRSGVDTVTSKRDTSQLIEVIEEENAEIVKRLDRLTTNEKTNKMLAGQMLTNQLLKNIGNELSEIKSEFKKGCITKLKSWVATKISRTTT